MREINFGWTEQKPLREALQAPFERVSARRAPGGAVISITLWSKGGSGIRVQNRMSELSDRCEVGVLIFDIVRESLAEEEFAPAPEPFRLAANAASKLVLHEDGYAVECGVILGSFDGAARIFIVAAANPYSLCIRGIASIPSYEPEYPMDRYAVTSFVPELG